MNIVQHLQVVPSHMIGLLVYKRGLVILSPLLLGLGRDGSVHEEATSRCCLLRAAISAEVTKVPRHLHGRYWTSAPGGSRRARCNLGCRCGLTPGQANAPSAPLPRPAGSHALRSLRQRTLSASGLLQGPRDSSGRGGKLQPRPMHSLENQRPTSFSS